MPTGPFQRAVQAFGERRFVLLLGAPGSGKTSIADALCMMSQIEGDHSGLHVISTGPQFEIHWNPSEPAMFLFDDVFGATSLDYAKLRGWDGSAWRKLLSAIRQGAAVIFASRDYIFE